MREEREAAASVSRRGSGKPPPHRPQPDGAGPPPPPPPAPPESLRNGYVRGCATPPRRDPPESVPTPPLCPGAAAASSSRRALLSLGALAAVALSLLAFPGRGGAGPQDGGGWRSPRALHALLSLSRCLSPLFSIACAFFFLTCRLARGERGATRWWLLALPVCCYSGDLVALRWLPPAQGRVEEPLAPGEPRLAAGRLLAALGSVAALTLLRSSAGLRRSLLVLLFSGAVWLVSLTGLQPLPPALRPLLAGSVGVAGCLLALRGAERGIFPARGRAAPRQHQPQPRLPGVEDKVPAVRPRRRSSCVSLGEASGSYYGSSKMFRRPSLPCISREQVGGSGTAGRKFEGGERAARSPGSCRCVCGVPAVTPLLQTEGNARSLASVDSLIRFRRIGAILAGCTEAKSYRCVRQNGSFARFLYGLNAKI